MYIKYVKQSFNVNQFTEEIGQLNDKISGFKHSSGFLTIYLSEVISPQQKVDLDNFVQNHSAQPIYPLRIFRKLSPSSDPLTSDFSILGFSKKAPHYDRGRKIKAEYWCPTNNEIVVEKVFKDIINESTGRLLSLEVTFNWYNENNEIALTKTEIVKELNKAQSETIMRQRRERSIDFLVSEARYTPNEPFIEMLINHYEVQITHFKDKGSNEFALALNSETDQTILTILSARVPFASDPTFTVPIKESIEYQIGAISENQLLTTLEPV